MHVFFNHLFGHIKPDSCPYTLVFGRKVWVKNLGYYITFYAATIVDNIDKNGLRILFGDDTNHLFCKLCFGGENIFGISDEI